MPNYDPLFTSSFDCNFLTNDNQTFIVYAKSTLVLYRKGLCGFLFSFEICPGRKVMLSEVSQVFWTRGSKINCQLLKPLTYITLMETYTLNFLKLNFSFHPWFFLQPTPHHVATATIFHGPLYPQNVHIQSQGVQNYVKKIKLLKVRFLIPSKNVLIVHIEKRSKNVDTTLIHLVHISF